MPIRWEDDDDPLERPTWEDWLAGIGLILICLEAAALVAAWQP